MHAPPGRDHIVVLRLSGAGSLGAFYCAGAPALGETSFKNTMPPSGVQPGTRRITR